MDGRLSARRGGAPIGKKFGQKDAKGKLLWLGMIGRHSDAYVVMAVAD